MGRVERAASQERRPGREVPEVKICDVTLRDGMQAVNHQAVLPLELRLRLAESLQRARLPYIEVGSFVHPKVIPAMRDSADLFAALRPSAGQELAALVPSLKYFRKLEGTPNIDTVALLVSASEAYARINTKSTREQALEAAREIATAARSDGYRVRAYLSYAFSDLSPASGGRGGDEMPPEIVAEICHRLLDVGCETIALSDTDGRARPQEIERTVGHLAADGGLEHIAVHLHDRYGLGVANALVAYQAGVRCFDASIGGVGGNKLLVGSVGNVATEELVNLFDALGISTGLDFGSLLEAGRILLEMISLAGLPPPPSKILANHPAIAGSPAAGSPAASP